MSGACSIGGLGGIGGAAAGAAANIGHAQGKSHEAAKGIVDALISGTDVGQTPSLPKSDTALLLDIVV